ncbi:MAG: hypothetical protein ACLTZT_04145 [Butyricimonas faecalis]
MCIASDDSSPDRWRQAVEQDGIGHFHHVLSGMKHTATDMTKVRISENGTGSIPYLPKY